MKNNELKENITDMEKAKEETDKRLLKLEWLIGYSSCISFLSSFLYK